MSDLTQARLRRCCFFPWLRFLPGARSSIAGAAATMLVDTPRTALAVVCLVPVVCALGEGCVNLVTGSYGVLDLASAALADAQISGLCFGSILLCIYQVAQEQKRSAE